jgi:hypothetical protein
MCLRKLKKCLARVHFNDVCFLEMVSFQFNNVRVRKNALQTRSGATASCVLDLHSTTQVVSRLHAIVLGKNFAV